MSTKLSYLEKCGLCVMILALFEQHNYQTYFSNLNIIFMYECKQIWSNIFDQHHLYHIFQLLIDTQSAFVDVVVVIVLL